MKPEAADRAENRLSTTYAGGSDASAHLPLALNYWLPHLTRTQCHTNSTVIEHPVLAATSEATLH